MTLVKERRSFICELTRIKKLEDDLYRISNEKNTFSHLWFQGVVNKINKTEDYLVLDDYTGVAKVIQISRMPNIWQELVEGSYIMVIGQCLYDGNKKASIKTVKIQILRNSCLEVCWPLEVFNFTANN